MAPGLGADNKKDMRIAWPNRFLIFGGLFLGFLFPVRGDVPTGDIADDSLLRLSIRDSWFVESPARVLNHRPFRHTLPGGDRVEVRSEVNGDEFMVILAREWPGPGGSYPGWAQGSWVLSRRRDTGAAVRIRIFLRSNFNTYVQFRPLDADRSQMDVVIYDAYMIHALPIPLAFDRLLVLPVEDVLGTADAKFPRRYFDPDAGAYEDIRNFIAGVRKRLPELTFRDDGAIDEEGRYVYINDLSYQEGTVGLNCSGFAKWIVDGILRPVTGTRLPISPLKQPFGERGSSFTEPYEALRDPFFGLDWTRNLASQAASRLRSSGLGTLEEIEVQKSPFASVIIRERGGTSIRSYPSFLPNAGFGFEGIQPLLYTLAIDEPGRLYLASINNELDPAPRMRQHFHIAVLVPYFNQYGIFQVAVFESAGETSFRAFRNRYPGHYINLVRIPVEGPFDP